MKSSDRAAQAHRPAGTGAALATTDEAIRQRTGRGWNEWFDALDAWGAPDRSHREIARWVAEQQGVHPLAWGAQAVTVSYERVRGLRAVGEHADGFAVTASKTVAVPVDRLYAAFVEPALRERWLPGATLRERTAQPGSSVRFDWADGATRVHVVFAAKDPGRSQAALRHERLPDARAADETKTYWRGRLAVLKAVLEDR